MFLNFLFFYIYFKFKIFFFEINALDLGAAGKIIRKFRKKIHKCKMLIDFQKSPTAESQVAWIFIARFWRTRPGSQH